jgi:hypothetical protein
MWRHYLIGAVIGGGLMAGVHAGWPEAPHEPQPVTMHEEMARQTVLLTRIVDILERWEAEGNAAKAAAEERSRRVMQGWQPDETQGLKELPKSFERKPSNAAH